MWGRGFLSHAGGQKEQKKDTPKVGKLSYKISFTPLSHPAPTVGSVGKIVDSLINIIKYMYNMTFKSKALNVEQRAYVK